MCGRFIVSYTYDDLLKFISTTFDIFNLDEKTNVPNYNVAPSTEVISVINDGSNYRIGTLKWGFITEYSNKGYKMINARMEGIEKKSAFKEAFRNKRCLILADGYYEWKHDGTKKTPFLIRKNDKKMFFFAGLYNKVYDESGSPVYSTTILTKKATNNLINIHDRMPVIFNEDTAKEWLDGSLKDEIKLLNLLEHSIEKDLATLQVSEYVNNVRNNSHRCIEEYIDNKLF